MSSRIKFLVLIGIIISFVGFVILLADSQPVSSDNKLKVVATTTQLYDFTKNIVGDKVALSELMKPNIDPHEFEPSPTDIQSISQATLIIYNGAGLERTIQKSIDESSAEKFKAIDVISTFTVGDDETNVDPHIWFSVENAKMIVTALSQKLQLLDPNNAVTYALNTQKFINELDTLDSYIKSQIALLNPSQRKIVTNHDAFGYYIKEYGLVYVGSVIPSLSTEDQPSPAETSNLINKIKSENVKAIFTENSINPKLAQQIADEAGAKVVSTLYGDTLGEPGSTGDTYIKMMMYNTDEIVKTLR